jgi:signal transduction histidine kinase
LTQVKGYADILADSVREGSPSLPQMAQISQGIGRAALRLEEIFTAMVDVSQIDAQELAITPTPLSVMSVLRFAVDNYKGAVKERSQILTLEGVDNLPPVQGDFQRLCQAFLNVIGNCIKYTPDGGTVSITGRALVGEPGNDSGAVEIVIADSGIGIDKADQELIFEKFYRVGRVELHSTGQTKFKGRPGLGQLIEGIIQAHGGKIWSSRRARTKRASPAAHFTFSCRCALSVRRSSGAGRGAPFTHCGVSVFGHQSRDTLPSDRRVSASASAPSSPMFFHRRDDRNDEVPIHDAPAHHVA